MLMGQIGGAGMGLPGTTYGVVGMLSQGMPATVPGVCILWLTGRA